MHSLKTCGCMSLFLSIQAESLNLWHLNNCWSWTLLRHMHLITSYLVWHASKVHKAHACSTIAWDPTVPIALNAVFQQSRWGMRHEAWSRKSTPSTGSWIHELRRGTRSAAGQQEQLRNSLFPMKPMKTTLNTTKPLISLFCFYDNWRFWKIAVILLTLLTLLHRQPQRFPRLYMCVWVWICEGCAAHSSAPQRVMAH